MGVAWSKGSTPSGTGAIVLMRAARLRPHHASR
jgi:hypothetical protein